MIEVLTEKGLKVSLENGRLAVSPKTKLTDNLRNFIWEQKEKLVLELRTRKLDSLLSSDSDLREQFEFEIEERTAIMIFDGGLSETEAVKLARENVTEIWFDLFV